MKGKPRASLRGLRTFCVAARHQSFRVAGEELFITASAVSHQVKGLEQELGQQLFERTTRSLQLTETGQTLYEEAHPLIDRLEELVAGYAVGHRRRTLRLSVQPFFGSEMFVPRMAELNDEHPDIDIELGSSDEAREKHPANVDLSIRLFRAPPEGFESDLIFPLRLVPVCASAFRDKLKLKRRRIVSDFPVIVHETYPQAWKQWSAGAGVQLPEAGKVTKLDTMIAVVRAAERGIGAALVPVPLSDAWIESGSLVRLFDHVLVADVSYYLVYRKIALADDGVAALRDWVLQTFADGR